MSVISDRALTQSINYGQVQLTQNQATLVLPANENRVKLYLSLSGAVGAAFLGSDNLVTPTNGFSFDSGIFSGGLDWQTDVYVYTTSTGRVAYYIEEVVS